MSTTLTHPSERLRHAGTVRVFYGLQAAVLGYTLVAQCFLTHHEGRSLVNTFSYFTIQSNVLVLVTALILTAVPRAAGRAWTVLRLGELCGITLTGIVYATLIAPYVHLTGWGLAYNYLFHYVMPIASVLGFVFVGPRARFAGKDLVFLVWPACWLLYTMLRGALVKPVFSGFEQTPSHYPYSFLNVGHVPVAEIVGSVLFITVMLIALGLAYIYADRGLERLAGARAGRRKVPLS
jgi:hypothetical protein